MRVMLAAILTMLGGCAAGVPAPPPGPATGLQSCGGTSIAAIIGQPITALPATGGWGTLRVIRPGDAVTMDYALSRLNIEIDSREVISRVTCG